MPNMLDIYTAVDPFLGNDAADLPPAKALRQVGFGPRLRLATRTLVPVYPFTP